MIIIFEINTNPLLLIYLKNFFLFCKMVKNIDFLLISLDFKLKFHSYLFTPINFIRFAIINFDSKNLKFI